ncbi:2-hydroxyacid dehydrogenase [Bosea sp. (in: a-proteobacteria)]|uniref:2-hydroxyacid dehydrogenase n=1 Tax=Bosea sp. (in: a-proteobacteria) TaxID=1871050 RepID=UPI0026212469|nr:2-hydroxyacid dehydrogenase [Bosea sp. (in: a-proteobacteria)]MCO5090765.1 2-hydroxyacid dehydrogenase [Bosea sp. (in: a-proteobacteria)]
MTATDKPEIVQTGPLIAYAADQLRARFTVHELWKATDRAALLAAVAERVRGVAVAGHIRIDGALFDALPRLEILSGFGVGYDNVDAAEAGRRGLVVTNTPDVLTEEVADLTIGLLLATVRQLPQADRHLRAGRWLNGPYPLTSSLRRRSVGIVGLGRIGKAVARRLEAFGLPIAYHGRSRQGDVPHRYYPSLLDMAADVDTLISVAPGGAATRHLIDAAVLKALGPDGVLINVGRGSVVDQAALIAALRDKTILSAGLDVFEDEPRVPAELIAIEQAVLLPHIGSASVHTRQAMGQLVVDNLVSWFEGRGPLTPVSETPWNKA